MASCAERRVAFAAGRIYFDIDITAGIYSVLPKPISTSFTRLRIAAGLKLYIVVVAVTVVAAREIQVH